MNLSDIETINRLCATHGVVEVLATITAHVNSSVENDYKDQPEAIIHQYAPVVNSTLEQIVLIRNRRLNRQ